jgi:diguanylate cyclase (GGDEF)-like protein
VFLSGTFIDITAQKESEAALARTLALYTATAESTTDGIIIIGTDRKILGHNRRYVEMWGLENIELGANADPLYEEALTRLKDPEGYRQRWAQTHSDPSSEASDVVELVDGRTLEVYSKPLMTEGVPTGRVWSWRDVSAQRELAEQLKHQAFHDSLTGLSNRAHFFDRLEHSVSRRRNGTAPYLLFLDLDDFKAVNDRFGHGTGDRVLARVARRISECLRAGDTAARLGGDEFAVLLDDVNNVDEAVKVADRILTVIRTPMFLEDREVILEASVGVVRGTRGAAAETLIGNADVAMYTAKAQGKGRVRVYEAGMHRLAADRQSLIADLRHAIVREQLIVHYQPGFELSSGHMVAAEALVRWNHPTRGLLSPDMFIHLAEDIGLIGAVGDFVMGEALRVMAHWQERYPKSFLVMGINVSARQLSHEKFGASIKRSLDKAGVDPRRLLLEITESALIEDPERSVKALHDLKKLGVSLALDDFGTGYSSLMYLKDLPIDILKIDRTFIDNITTSKKEALLTEATVALGHQLGLRIVAEGIERHDQLAKLIDLGCEYGQGFLFSQPLARDDFDAFVLSHQHSTCWRAA